MVTTATPSSVVKIKITPLLCVWLHRVTLLVIVTEASLVLTKNLCQILSPS